MEARPNGNTYDRHKIDDLKARIDLLDVVQKSGVSMRKMGQNWLGRCPFHDDGDASLSVNPAEQLWRCFGCDTGGDVLNYLQLKESLTFPQALERISLLAGEHPHPIIREERPDRENLPGGFTRPQLLERVADMYAHGLRESKPAQQYLVSRGLDSGELWKAFRVGAATGALMATLPAVGGIRDAMTALGIVTPKGREFFAGCVVVPLTHPDQGVVGMYGRKISPDAKVRHLYLPGPMRGVLNWQALKLSEHIVIAESVIDALSLWMAGCAEITCLYGSNGLTNDLQELMGRFGTREVRWCLDADEEGAATTIRLTMQLSRKGIRCLRIALPEGKKDPNQALMEEGIPALQEALANPLSNEPTDPPLPSAEPLPSKPERQETGDGFVLIFGPIQYRTTPRPPFTGKLRVTLRVTCAEREERSFMDTLDLFSHRARCVAIGQIVHRLHVRKAEVERHFLALVAETETWVDALTIDPAEGGTVEAVKRAPEMSAEEREEALAFLRRDDLVETILLDMEALGYAGEEQGKLLAYLIGISRRLDRPLSGIVMSQSGAGKSSLAELVEMLTPAENVVLYSRISAQALGYLPRDFLKRKLLILEERVGAEAAEYQIRILQSRQRLSQAVVVKDPTTGKMHTRHFEVEGPIAYIETTTNSRINHENATRCFEIHLDESEEQTKRIHDRQREGRKEGARRRLNTDAIRRRHHNAQRLLQPVKVFIPYVDLLSFPTRWLRTRRDHERFLCLIEAAAFLHQYQRDGGVLEDSEDITRFIRASVADYALAYNLAREVLQATLHELSREGRELWEAARQMMGQGDDRDRYFTRRDLRQHTDWHDHRLRDALQELVDMEYIGIAGGSQGRTYQYRLLAAEDEEPMTLRELTTPEQLQRMLETGGS